MKNQIKSTKKIYKRTGTETSPQRAKRARQEKDEEEQQQKNR
jgi:hypothetical protein